MKLPYPALIFSGQLKTRHAPGTSFEPYPIPVLAEPKKIIAELAKLRSLKSFASPDAVNTATSPQLPKYVSAAFGSPRPSLETRPPAKQFDRSGRSAERLNVIFAGEAIESGLRRNGREPGYGDA